MKRKIDADLEKNPKWLAYKAKLEAERAKRKPVVTESMKDFLNRTNGGHSTTILGVFVDMKGNPITGRY